IVVAILRAGPDAERLDEIGQKLVLRKLGRRGVGDVQDLAAQGKDRLGLAVARAFGGAAGAVALDDEDLGAARLLDRAVGELAGEAQLARRRLAPDLLLAPPLESLLGLVDRPFEQPRRLLRAVGEP